MNTRRFVLRETGMLAIGEALCAGIMVGIFALLKHYSTQVLLGAIIGVILTVGNFFLMAVAAEAASDKAMNGDVKGGKALVKTSRQLRLIGLFALLAVFIKTDLCNPIAIVVPLVLERLVLLVVEFFRKAGEETK